MRTGDRDAEFSAFVDAKQAHLLRVAYALCGDWQRAEDILQTALTKLYLAWPRVRRDGCEEAYTRRIILNADIDERRRPWRREKPGLEWASEPSVAASSSVEERSALIEALTELPPMQRRTVVLRHWLDLSVAETAVELGISEGTVKSHSSRGLSALQRHLSSSQS